MIKLGVVFPQTEFGNDAGAFREWTLAVEKMGFSHVYAYDHVIGANKASRPDWAGPYHLDTPFHEPFTLFAFMAGVSKKLSYVSGVFILPQRQTVLFAKQAACLDVLCEGRLRLGIGTGWNDVEYTALNENFHNRGRRQAEQVAVLRALWTQRLVNFQGKYHTIPDAGLWPLPVQQPIPIWFGGGSDAALRRMAQLGDGWMTNTGNLDQLTGELATLRGYISDAGRDPSTFGVEFRMSLRRDLAPEWPGMIERLAGLGVSHVSINTMNSGLEDVQAHLAAIERFADSVRG